MNRLAKLQLLGPLALFLAVLAAESAVYALAVAPRSEWLWYVNLKLFVIFQRSHYILSDLTTVPGSQLIFIALPIFVAACYGFIRGRALPLALASNLSFAYAAFLLVSWNMVEKTASLQASLAVIVIPSGASFYTLSILLGCSVLSFVVSHLLYVYAIRAKA